MSGSVVAQQQYQQQSLLRHGGDEHAPAASTAQNRSGCRCPISRRVPVSTSNLLPLSSLIDSESARLESLSAYDADQEWKQLLAEDYFFYYGGPNGEVKCVFCFGSAEASGMNGLAIAPVCGEVRRRPRDFHREHNRLCTGPDLSRFKQLRDRRPADEEPPQSLEQQLSQLYGVSISDGSRRRVTSAEELGHVLEVVDQRVPVILVANADAAD